MYGKIWYDEDIHDLRSIETEFPSIVFNDALTSKVALSCEPTVSPLNDNQIDFRISFDESDDEDYMVIYDKSSFSYKIISVNDLKMDSENDNDKVNMPSFSSSEPTVNYFDDFDYFKDFEKELPAIAYNDALTSKLDFSKPTVYLYLLVPTSRYVVPTGRVIATVSIKVPTGSSNAKFPYLKKDEYETWAIKMEYWIMNTDHNLWNIVLHGNSRKRTGRDPRGNIMILPPVTMEEQIAVQRETKARTILLQSLPEDHMADFHHLDDAKDIWLAVKARFGGNEESKKMRKSMLKQEFADFNQMQARPDNEDCNMKFLRALPPSWSQVAITLKTKGGLDFLSFNDLYNKLRILEIDVKGGSSYDSRVPAAPTHSAFISDASKWSTADSKCQPSSVSYTTTSSSADTSGNVL
ncbi:hypothetical protein Tco_0515026, partial [Tanacetum coccineum]